MPALSPKPYRSLLVAVCLLCLFLGTLCRPVAAQSPPINLTAAPEYQIPYQDPSAVKHFVILHWSAPSNPPSIYTIERKTGAGGTWAVVHANSSQFPYYTDDNLLGSTTYVYRVHSQNGSAVSLPSNEVSVTTLPDPPPNPPTPTGLTAAGGDGQVTLSWNGSAQASYYLISIYTDQDDGSHAHRKAPSAANGTACTFTVTGLTNGSSYGFSVAAVTQSTTNTSASGTSYSPDSNGVLATPLAPPVGLTAMAIDSYVSLTWQPVTGAASYNLYRTVIPQTTPTVIQSVLGSSTIDSTIMLGQTYSYQVSALSDTGESTLSPPVTVTPLGSLTPVVKMTAPFDGSAVTAGTSLLLSASAMPRSGSLSKIDFYSAPAQYDSSGNPVVGTGTLLGTATAPPYNLFWNSVPTGSVFLTAVATDDGGHRATSAPLTISVSAAPTGTALTAAQAIQAALVFCQSVGAPISLGTPTSAQTTTASSTYGGTVWQVGFSGAASVEIADVTGVIVSYFNETLAGQLDANNQSLGTPLSQAQAQTIAASVLQASNQSPVELAAPQFTQSNLTYPATYAGDLWTVRWNRVSGAVPYRTDQATLLLQAETGAVEAWKLAFPTPVLVPAAATVSQSQAQATAQAAMTAQGSLLGLSNQVFQASQQAVVQPNTLWPPPGSTTPGTTTPIPGSASRTVWDCFFTDLPAGATSLSGSMGVEIWVDAATGQVIGGYLSKVKGHRPNLHSLQHSLSNKHSRSKPRSRKQSARTANVGH